MLKEGAAKVTSQARAADPDVKPGPKNGEIGNGRSSDNVKPTQGGNDATYLVRRLKRDAPDVAKALADAAGPRTADD